MQSEVAAGCYNAAGRSDFRSLRRLRKSSPNRETSTMRHAFHLLLVGLACTANSAFADEPVSLKNFKAPADNRKDEPLAGAFSLEKAAHFIDSAALHWTKSQGCFSCHSNLTYLYARPIVPGPAPAHADVRHALEELV